MPFLKIDSPASSVSLYFEDYGQGKPVVLVHGWPLSHRMWEPQVGPLVEAGYRVISYDRRGFGDSDKPYNGYDYDTMAADLQALLAALELNDSILVGFSMGGGEVARYFGRYGGERISRAVLVSAVTPYLLQTDDNPDGVDKSVFEKMMQGVKTDRVAFLEGFGKLFVNWNESNPPISKELLEYNHTIASFASPRATAECITAFSETDFRQDLPKMTVPTLLVHGDADQIVPLEVSAEKAAPLIPESRLEVISGAPHGLNSTHSEQLNRLLLDFLHT